MVKPMPKRIYVYFREGPGLTIDYRKIATPDAPGNTHSIYLESIDGEISLLEECVKTLTRELKKELVELKKEAPTFIAHLSVEEGK